jgi:hypothetical protein
MCNHRFVRVRSEICVKNSSHSSIRNPQRQQRVFERNASEIYLSMLGLVAHFQALGFLGNADPLALTFETHRMIVFRSGTASFA